MKNFRSGRFELQMKLTEGVGIVQNDFGRKRTRADPAPLLELEKVASITQHRAFNKTFQDSFFASKGLDTD